MRSPLTIAAVQPGCAAYDVSANAIAHAAMVRQAQARVVVFPELSLTGYQLDAAAVEPADPALTPLVEACAATGSLALAGAPVREAGPGGATGEHIAVLAVDGEGVTVAYRKLYLGTPEAKRFSPGPAPVVLEVDGWRLGLAVCKDFNTPQHQTRTVALGIDVYVAGTVKHDYEEAAQSERAAALAAQHGVWVAVASMAGPSGDGFDRTAGGSGIWQPGGNAVARTGPQIGGAARATIA